MRYFDVETFIKAGSKGSVFTYAYESEITPGSLVLIPFGNKTITGIAIKPSSKPSFNVKTIQKVISNSPVPDKFQKFANWFFGYYPVKRDEISGMFLPSFLRTTARKTEDTTPVVIKTAQQPPLTPDQASTIKQISEEVKPVILHGVVGSGKTRIYLELTSRTLKNNRSVMILSPEIPLSSHLLARAKQFFPNHKVLHYHSELTDAQRRKVWLESLTSEEPLVVIGPRSCLFLPLRDIGLVIVDEFHESSYKQQDGIRFHTTDAAAAMASICKAKLILGSATPPIREYEIALQKNYPIIRLEKLAASEKEPKRKYVIVDQKDRSQFTTHNYLSNALIKEINISLKNEQQILLLHNRRGTARTIICSSCAWSLLCQRCESKMVFHHDENVCRCHICGWKTALPTACPDCGKSDILLRSIGSKALVDEVIHLFPGARVARFDSDNKKHERLGNRLEEIEAGNIDILVGTQLLAKGLDIKNLRVVGIINADSSLQIPDFSSNERLYQLIVQASGRVARGHGEGVCVIQTYQPKLPIFKSIEQEDWQNYYDQEVQERKKHHYPPFRYIVKLNCSRKSLAAAEKAALNLKNSLEGSYSNLRILGPSPSLVNREAAKHTQQLIVRSKSRAPLLEIARNLPANWSADIDPISLI